MTARQPQWRGGKQLSVVGDTITRTIAAEHEALGQLRAHMPPHSLALVQLLHNARTIFMTGIGKSGLIARALVATLCSLGVPAMFIHPTDALHGDIGAVQPDDVCVLISKSGASSELATLARTAQSRNAVCALITMQQHAPLATAVATTVVLPSVREADRDGVVPTSSLTTTLAFGHALAISVAEQRGFTARDLAKTHPAGSIGNTLLLTAADIIAAHQPVLTVAPNDSFFAAMSAVARSPHGVVIVGSSDDHLQGVITADCLTSAASQHNNYKSLTAQDLMQPLTARIAPTAPATEVWACMQRHHTTYAAVINTANTCIGIIVPQNLRAAGVHTQTREAS